LAHIGQGIEEGDAILLPVPFALDEREKMRCLVAGREFVSGKWFAWLK
jgi:hypothetical protein